MRTLAPALRRHQDAGLNCQEQFAIIDALIERVREAFRRYHLGHAAVAVTLVLGDIYEEVARQRAGRFPAGLLDRARVDEQAERVFNSPRWALAAGERVILKGSNSLESGCCVVLIAAKNHA